VDFLRELTEEAQQERKGLAILAAGVFDKFRFWENLRKKPGASETQEQRHEA